MICYVENIFKNDGTLKEEEKTIFEKWQEVKTKMIYFFNEYLKRTLLM